MRSDLIDPMLMSITTPGLPPFYGNYGLWETAMALPALAGLRTNLPEGCNGTANTLDRDVFEEGEVPVCLRAEDDWPMEMQFLNCRWLEHLEGELVEAILAALVARVPTLRSAYDFLEAQDFDRFLPKNPDEATMARQIWLRSVTIHPIRSATPYLGLEFDCAWDIEHGIGFLTYGSELIEIGEAEVATNGSAATAHCENLLEALRANGPAAAP